MPLYQLQYSQSAWTEIIVSSLDGHDNDLFEKQIRDCGDAQNRKTNVKANMTDWNLSQHENWRKLAFDVVKYGVLRLAPKLVTGEQVNWGVTQMWGNMYNHGDFTIDHHHIPSSWSFVYYVKAPCGSSGLIFPDINYTFNPKEGDYVLFPAHLRHGVRSNLSREPRISIAGNICQLFEIPKENNYVYDI